MIKKYIDYLKDNPQGYWFKRKLYGWGWVPVKWQGWLVILVFIIFLAWNGIDISSETTPSNNELIWFFAKIVIFGGIMIFICYKKGERPRWQWGLDEDKKPKL